MLTQWQAEDLIDGTIGYPEVVGTLILEDKTIEHTMRFSVKLEVVEGYGTSVRILNDMSEWSELKAQYDRAVEDAIEKETIRQNTEADVVNTKLDNDLRKAGHL